MITVLKKRGIRATEYDIHINFPGGTPVDGPSAGIAIATAIFSALNDKIVDPKAAMTGEISIHGKVKPVGGVFARVAAAKEAGVKKVFIPKENNQQMLQQIKGVQIIPVTDIAEVFENVFLQSHEKEMGQVISAASGFYVSPTGKI